MLFFQLFFCHVINEDQIYDYIAFVIDKILCFFKFFIFSFFGSLINDGMLTWQILWFFQWFFCHVINEYAQKYEAVVTNFVWL